MHFTKLLVGFPTEGTDDPNSPVYTDAVYGDKLPPEIAAKYVMKDDHSSSKAKRKQADVKKEAKAQQHAGSNNRGNDEDMRVD